jgi:hypothetical protein
LFQFTTLLIWSFFSPFICSAVLAQEKTENNLQISFNAILTSQGRYLKKINGKITLQPQEIEAYRSIQISMNVGDVTFSIFSQLLEQAAKPVPFQISFSQLIQSDDLCVLNSKELDQTCEGTFPAVITIHFQDYAGGQLTTQNMFPMSDNSSSETVSLATPIQIKMITEKEAELSLPIQTENVFWECLPSSGFRCEPAKMMIPAHSPAQFILRRESSLSSFVGKATVVLLNKNGHSYQTGVQNISVEFSNQPIFWWFLLPGVIFSLILYKISR